MSVPRVDWDAVAFDGIVRIGSRILDEIVKRRTEELRRQFAPPDPRIQAMILLGVWPGADGKTITHAYWDRVRQIHTDLTGREDIGAEMVRLDEARDLLLGRT